VADTGRIEPREKRLRSLDEFRDPPWLEAARSKETRQRRLFALLFLLATVCGSAGGWIFAG
jgi:hypothetical protein